MSAKKDFIDAKSVDLEVTGGRSSLLGVAFEAEEAMGKVLIPLIEASAQHFDTLEAESKVQIRKSEKPVITPQIPLTTVTQLRCVHCGA